MSPVMISVNDAIETILSHVAVGEPHTVPLLQARGSILANPVIARVNVPSFDNSAMDGFALDHRLTTAASKSAPVQVPVVGSQPAGAPHYLTTNSQSAIRIMTGAVIPAGATAVIQHEMVTEQNEIITLSAPVAEGLNIRHTGEDTTVGDPVLKRGDDLSPPVIGYLASIGTSSVSVISKPRVAIIPTGSELVSSEQTLQPGHIYNSNGPALSATIAEHGIDANTYPPMHDDISLQTTVLKRAISEHDIIIITGGVSVGRYDHIKDILCALNVKPLFWKVNQKPGKPLWVGICDGKIVFGLPGNPVSALTCYYQFVRPAIRKWMGHSSLFLMEVSAQCRYPIKKEPGRTLFLNAITDQNVNEWSTHPHGIAESHRMRPFAEANSMIVLDEACGNITEGDHVRVQLLPHYFF